MKIMLIIYFLLNTVEVENGIWISKKWVSKNISFGEVKRLNGILDRYKIKFVFFKAGKVDNKGNLKLSPHAIHRFVSLMKNINAERKLLLWTGGIIPRFAYFDPAFKKNFLLSIKKALASVDGIHIDIEPLSRTNDDIEPFLHDIKQVIGNKLLSCALPLIGNKNFPSYITSHTILYPFFVYCDQVVIMGYDTGEYIPNSYIRLLVEQVKIYIEGILRTSSSADILLGIPSYDEVSPYHNPKVENIENAVKGFFEARETLPFASLKLRGISIYAEWTTDAKEWLILERLLTQD